MASSGNWLLVQRIVTVTLFKLLRLVFTTVQGVCWRLTGTERLRREALDPGNYDRCAQVLDVVAFHKFCVAMNTSVEDFLWTHRRFESPQYIIDNDHISLVTINDTYAVFGEPERKGMHLWRSAYSPFIRLAQMEHCKRLIIVPLAAFHRMADIIGDPKAEIIFLFNTARCGSTLLTQVMECTGRCVAISEPDSPNLIATRFRKHGDTVEIRQLARDVIRWECRPYLSIQPPPLAYMIKLSAPSAVALPFFRALYPDSKSLFMYRDVLTVSKSLYRLSQVLPTMRLGFTLGRLSESVPEKLGESMGYNGSDFRIRIRHDLTMGVLLSALTINTYLDMRRSGFAVSALSYKDLVSRPLETCRCLMEFCGLPVSLAELAVKGLEFDSQRNSPLAKSLIGHFPVPEVTEKDKESFNHILKKFSLPLIDEELVLEGTLTH